MAICNAENAQWTFENGRIFERYSDGTLFTYWPREVVAAGWEAFPVQVYQLALDRLSNG